MAKEPKIIYVNIDEDGTVNAYSKEDCEDFARQDMDNDGEEEYAIYEYKGKVTMTKDVVVKFTPKKAN
jgi:hypothetical protein